MKFLIFIFAMLAVPRVILPWGLASAAGGSDPETMAAETNGLKLAMTLKYDETSKDANWRQLKAEIHGKTMRLAKEFGGFDAPGNETREIILDANLESRIWAFIRDKKLDVRLDQERPTQGPGVAGYLNLEIKEPPASTLRLIGKTDIWGSDEYVRENWGPDLVATRTNLDHLDYFQKAESFFQFLWNLKP